MVSSLGCQLQSEMCSAVTDSALDLIRTDCFVSSYVYLMIVCSKTLYRADCSLPGKVGFFHPVLESVSKSLIQKCLCVNSKLGRSAAQQIALNFNQYMFDYMCLQTAFQNSVSVVQPGFILNRLSSWLSCYHTSNRTYLRMLLDLRTWFLLYFQVVVLAAASIQNFPRGSLSGN